MPRQNKITIRQGSGTPTASAFATAEPAFDPATGKLWVKGASEMVEFGGPTLASYPTSASFPATGLATVLYLATDSSKIYQWSGVYVEVGVESGYMLPNATSSTLGGVVVGAGLSVSSGTVSANVVSVAGRTGTVTISSGDVSGLPTAGTGSTNYCAGNDSRLSDSRTPTDGSVTDAKIASNGLSTSSLNWAAITAWAANTAYAKGDLVEYIGVAYRRSAAGTSGATFNSANWQQITPSSFVASQITSGTIDTARLGSGTASSSTFLRGDGAWSTVSATESAIHPFLLMGG